MNKTYLLLGSNLGDSRKQLSLAAINIEKYIGKIVRQSGNYQTAAWGNTEQPDFVNQVIIVETILDAPKVLDLILSIEKEMGRVRKEKNAARTIDIDILFFNEDIFRSEALTIPHQYIQDRRFVLVPLNELSPLFVHPVLGKTIHQLLEACTDKLDVKKI